MQVQRFDSVDSIPACYDPLFELAASRSFFWSRAWLENLSNTVVAPGDRTPVFAVARDGAPVGLLPCWKPGPHHPSVTSDLQGLASFYSSLFGVVMDWPSEHGAQAVDELVAALVRAPEAGHRICLAPLSRDDGQLDALAAAFHRQGWWTRRYFCFGNWFLPCAGTDFAAYLAARPSALRNTLRRKQRQFDRMPGARLEIIQAQAQAELERGLHAFQAVYARSWKQAEPYPDFIPGLIRCLGARGWLRLGVAWVDERPVAAQIWVICHGVASIYKLAYDADFKDLSAGSVLSALLMRHALDDAAVTEVDYLTGDDRYKRDWMSDRRERWGIVAFNPGTARGLIEGATNLVSNWGQQLWRRVRPRDRDTA